MDPILSVFSLLFFSTSRLSISLSLNACVSVCQPIMRSVSRSVLRRWSESVPPKNSSMRLEVEVKESAGFKGSTCFLKPKSAFLSQHHLITLLTGSQGWKKTKKENWWSPFFNNSMSSNSFVFWCWKEDFDSSSWFYRGVLNSIHFLFAPQNCPNTVLQHKQIQDGHHEQPT